MNKRKKSDLIPELYPINQLKLNPMNPRVIEDSNFQKLVNSIKNASWMLQIRPILINKDLIVLGGNQRLKACLEAGFKEVWALNVEKIEDSKQRELIILDNKDYGKWDKDLLKSQFSTEELERYDLLDIVDGAGAVLETTEKTMLEDLSTDGVEPEIDENKLADKLKTYQNNTIKQIVLYYPDELYEKALRLLDEIGATIDCDDNSEVVLRLINFWEFHNGKEPTELADSDTEQGKSGSDEDSEAP